ncbi:NAD(P)/FAD-dependent oxidoreductase [Aliamphritea spongicola]|uniref:NAD(P)/FAD-dependent oxidoreductase n=1 Tax=Aliamphritea spongicola TaxID=707589 RepID=UPI00196A35C0|nr:FAD-binding oxidoreductase [Aliamphritea spongicola]MBN3560889.1 FAD-binding oxidoreductase [Aliamphritea spongicola]
MSRTIRVSQVPKETGPAAWNEILDDSHSFPQASGSIETDWLVIGGGFAGIAAARRLSQLTGDDIVLLEACRMAEGPAGRNSGFMIDLPHDLNSETYAGGKEADLKQIMLNRAGIEFAADMAREFGMSSQVFDPCGRVTGAASERGMAHIDSYVKHLDGLGESYNLLSASDMQNRTGISYYQKGLYTPGAVMIQPAAYIRQAARGLSDKVRIFEQSPVVEMSPGTPHRLRTPKARIRAKKVILAVNGHVQSFGYYPRQLLHVFTYASMTRALSGEELQRLGGEADWGVLPADPMGTTVRKTSDYMGSGHRLTVRNRFTLNQSMEISQKDIDSIVKVHDRAFTSRFPMLADVPLQHRWGGRLCLSWNSVPAFGELEPGIWSAACQNGLGTVKGTLSGMLAAEQAVLGDTELVREFSNYAEPKRLPVEPFLSVGANVNLRWKEWLAGKEL